MMNIQLEYIVPKYINLLSTQVRNFRRISNEHWRMSCPICGDSKKNKLKARGEVFKNKGVFFYKCHNCGIAFPAMILVKHVNPILYNEYILEKVKEIGNRRTKIHSKEIESEYKPKAPVFRTQSILTSIDCILDIDRSHDVWHYVLERRIPESYWKDLYYTDEFYSWVNSIIPGKFKNQQDEPRLVIPFFTRDRTVEVFQGRSLGYSPIKYYTIKVHDNAEKVFGYDRLDDSKTIIVLEGPIDSMFIDNSVAVSDAALYKFDKYPNCVYAFDNEPRNREIIKHINRAIQRGFRVCIWGDDIKQKDINDMVLAGYDPNDLKKYILTHSYSGLTAQLQLSRWKKV